MSWFEDNKVTCYSVVSAGCLASAVGTFLLGIGGPTNSLWIFLGLLAAGMTFGELARRNRA
jgi:energy-converting hydrogenase Eha subunit B